MFPWLAPKRKTGSLSKGEIDRFRSEIVKEPPGRLPGNRSIHDLFLAGAEAMRRDGFVLSRNLADI